VVSGTGDTEAQQGNISVPAGDYAAGEQLCGVVDRDGGLGLARAMD
jgi:hypothetical protein